MDTVTGGCYLRHRMGPRQLYVVDHRTNQAVWVIVRTSQWGNAYLTTQADGESQSNLLSLPECPR
jgi:hypothetical protein